MIARHEGQVLLVAGAIPGEQVRARVERVDKRMAYATTEAVLEPSPDRRDAAADPLCGGFLYSQIRYERQLTLKGEVVADAFTRLGRLSLAAPVVVAASEERGYRMRARFHVRGVRAGFFREGTHEICDAGATGQLHDGSVAAVQAAVASLVQDVATPVSVELTENILATERALHADVTFGSRVSAPALARASAAAGLRGCTARTPGGVLVSAADPTVADSFAALTGRDVPGELRRHPESFFPSNRYLHPSLVSVVLEAVPAAGAVLELYAGVGLFSLSLAACGRTGVTAVEGDAASGRDQKSNPPPIGDTDPVVVGRVEEYLSRAHGRAGTIVVDPPRTGVSKEAMEAIARHGATRIVYVSCDAPTMARDARRLVDAGYRIASLRGFDLCPNTPHVETVGVFDRA